MRGVVISVVVAIGCGNGGEDSDTEVDTDTMTQSTMTAACALNANVPTALNCTWSSDVSGQGWIEYWLDGEEHRQTPLGADTISHAVSAIGLRAGQTWNFQVVTTTADGEVRGPEQSVDTPVPPSLVPVNELFQVKPASTAKDSYILSSMIDWADSVPIIVDGKGRYVWWFTGIASGQLILSTRLSKDGKSVLFASYDMNWQDDVGTIWRVALDGSEVTETRALLAHHDFLEVEGGFVYLSYAYRQYDQTMWVTDALRQVPEGSTQDEDSTILFDFFDDYPVDPWIADPLHDNVALGDADREWTHSNSLMDAGDGHYYIMSKVLDLLIKITDSGELVWEMGGAYSDFTNLDGSEVWRSPTDYDLWSHAHMSHLWLGGMAVFDNGFHGIDGNEHSRAVEYAFDEQTGQIAEVWSYDEPNGGFTKLMGDVRKLDSTYLINWSSMSYVSEITLGGDIVWLLDLDDLDGPSGNKVVMSRLTVIDDLYDPTIR